MAKRGAPAARLLIGGLLCSLAAADTRSSSVPSRMQASALGPNLICSNIPGLTAKQRSLCNTRPDVIMAIWEGSKISTLECQWQFRHMRWNCSQLTEGTPISHSLPLASKEAGYAHAVSSAGVAYAIIQACTSGSLKGCGCDRSKSDGQWSPEGWRWGGCSADIGYGVEFARIFVDARETGGDGRALVNLHNNRLGRKVLSDSAQVECKCHGPSGSCTIKTCWTTLPPFRRVGDALMEKFNKAKQVVSQQQPATVASPPSSTKQQQQQRRPSGKQRAGVAAAPPPPPPPPRPPQQQQQQPPPPRALSSAARLELRRARRENGGRPRNGDLVFLDESPTYCEPDRKVGSPGTRGRQCNKTSDGTDGCHLLCCGRGYNTHEVARSWQCDCKFHWCCSVTCRTCAERREVYTCK